MARRLAAVALVLLLSGGTPALAADTKATDGRDARVAALDITKLSATGGDFGLIVTATFRGDVSPSALYAMVLRPRTGAGNASVLARRGDRVMRRTKSADVDVQREGKTLRFYVLGTGLSGVRRIEIKAFASTPRAAQTDPVILNAAAYRAIVDNDPADEANLRPPSSEEVDACRSLATRIDELDEESERAPTNRELRRVLRLRGDLIDVFKQRRCPVQILVFSSGYQHRPGETDICADIQQFPNLGDLFAFILYRGEAMVAEGRPEYSVTSPVQRIKTTVKSYGTYRLHVFNTTGPDTARDVEINVVEPPPDRTKTCSP